LNTVLDFIKSLIAKEPARLVAWASAAAVAAALKAADMAGVTLTPEVIAGVSAIAAFLATELIRRFVYAPATVEAMK
jgi:hypothetical protein